MQVTVPRLGWTMEEGTLVEWLKADGDAVKVGDPLFALESDKATETIEALDAGTLRIAAAAGEKVKVGQVIGQLLSPSPSVSGGEGLGVRGVAATSGGQAALSVTPTPLTPNPSPPETGGEGDKKITPRARRAARELGVDPARLHGTGANGRVRERDVRATAPAGGRLIPHIPTRKTIAARMVAGVTVAAPVTLTTTADATNLVSLRAQLKSLGEAPTLNDLLLTLTARVLRQHPMLQAQWRDDGLFVPDGVHVAIGVDADAGLVAPVIRDADRRPLRQLAQDTRALISKAREGRLYGDDLRGATFTVTNLGMFGVDAFTPILTLPQCAALGVGRVHRGELTLSLTFDHRVVDGAPAARFLDGVRKAVENAAAWLIE